MMRLFGIRLRKAFLTANAAAGSWLLRSVENTLVLLKLKITCSVLAPDFTTDETFGVLIDETSPKMSPSEAIPESSAVAMSMSPDEIAAIAAVASAKYLSVTVCTRGKCPFW